MYLLITLLVIVVVGAGILLAHEPWRQQYLTRHIFRQFRRVIPLLSDTEREALEAGTVWWEGQLFSGKPQWDELLSHGRPTLTPDERSFLDEETDTLCTLVDDWALSTRDFDMPDEAWIYMKEKGFLGLIIPKEYGGKGFSALAHSEVVRKLSTRCSALAVTVMVPNSLGPAELLLHYGTAEQKSHYLPRLARGDDIPAFALTSPWAGSDASSIPDYGVVCKDTWDGQEVIGMRLNWDKRYITLAPVCTLLGVAFRLYDPDGLIGDQVDLGITLALVPAHLDGIEIGRRHLPLDAMFMNGPTRGHEVFMPLSFIVGGPTMVGQGWRMLMECLAAGRSISLPASFCGMATLTARTVGAYSAIRNQFSSAIARFEGVQELLARIGGNLYAMDATRRMTAHAIDLGEKPSVVSAIAKYHITERGRSVVMDGMDLLGGKGICLGPSNFLARAYQQLPVGITVEGANILTRSLIIFGQGALRCHPYLLAEMQAVQDPDKAKGMLAFDAAFWSHARHTTFNGLRAFWHALTGAVTARVDAPVSAITRAHYKQLTRYSAAFALTADVSMLLLGGSLKRRERLSARLGDMLSQLYIASATLKRFEDEGCPPEDAAAVHWVMRDALYQFETALDGVFRNLPNRPVAVLLRIITLPLGRLASPPSDRLDTELAKRLTRSGPARERLTAHCFLPPDDQEPLAVLEAALPLAASVAPLHKKIRLFQDSGRLSGNPVANVRDLADAVYAAGGISLEEYEALQAYNRLRDQVIAVDDFPRDLSPPGARSDVRSHPA
jgi:Acyl-CoA dehydrogenases